MEYTSTMTQKCRICGKPLEMCTQEYLTDARFYCVCNVCRLNIIQKDMKVDGQYNKKSCELWEI
jgi:hypothetical protein